MLHSSVSY